MMVNVIIYHVTYIDKSYHTNVRARIRRKKKENKKKDRFMPWRYVAMSK